MEWDLGWKGLALLAGMSLVFGAIVHAIAWRTSPTRWLWLIASGVFFVGGMFVSEVLFGWATEEELQPNIDGLSFDEVLLFGLVLLIGAALGTWLIGRRRRGRPRPA
jgi:hypothetical protein